MTGRARLPLAALAAASIGLGIAQLTPAILTLPLIVARLTPGAESETLSVIIATGAILSLLALPAFGWLSDRTKTRLGRRRPWLIGGAVALLAGAVGLAAASDVVVVTLSWWCSSLGTVAATVAMSAAVADQIPRQRRGPASAAVGLGQPLGVLAGLLLAQPVADSLVGLALVPAAVGAAGVFALGLSMTDAAQPDAVVEPSPRRAGMLNAIRAALVTRDFRWVWLTRLLLSAPIAAFAAYIVYFLTLRMEVPPIEIPSTMLVLWSAMGLSTLAAAAIAGRISDRIGRRKVFIVAGGVLIAGGLFGATFAGDVPAMCLAVAVLGVGQGLYLAVELAITTRVLPDSANPAGALGVANLASNLPGVLVPTIAPLILALGSNLAAGYGALFATAAILALLGAAAVLPVHED